MAFDFSKIKVTGNTCQKLANKAQYDVSLPDSLVGYILCHIDGDGCLRPDNSDTTVPRIVLKTDNPSIYIIPYAEARTVDHKYTVKPGLEILKNEWINISKKVKKEFIGDEKQNNSSDKTSVAIKKLAEACIALKILVQHPYRKEGENATQKDRALLGIEKQMHISAQDLSDIELIVREVNQLQLPKFLQEEQCKTFGDLYNTLDHLWISIMGTETSNYSDLLGVYEGKQPGKCVKLFLDKLKEYSKGSQDRFRSLVRTTYIHELFHAYFDIFFGTDLHKPSIQEVEEPLVEYAMLLTLEEHYSSQICAEARKDVNSKKKNEKTYHYAIGSSSKLTPEVLLRYKYLKFLIEYAEFKKAVESYESLAKDQKNIDKCAKELVALLEDPEVLKKAQDKAPTSTTPGNANQ